MTPQDKAKQFTDKFGAKADLVVDEIIEAINIFGYQNTMYDDPETGQIRTSGDPCEYWLRVKNHLTKAQ